MYRGLRALPEISCHVRVSAYMRRYAGFTAAEKTSIDLHGRYVDDQDFDNPDHYEAAVLTRSSLQDRDRSVIATTHDESR